MLPESDLPADLFTTNRAPDDGELALARALIHDLENQRHGLTTAPAVSEAREFYALERSILVRLYALKHVVAPIRRVPGDIIREIFLACIEPDTFPSMSSNDVPCTLSHISGGLRQIALSTPALWAAFRVNIDKHRTFSMRGSKTPESLLLGQASWLKQWIYHRSGNLPLRISFSEHGPDVLLDSYKHIIDLVISCHSRWRYITFRCLFESSTHLLSSLQSLTPHDVPQLYQIDFGIGQDNMDDLQIFPMPLLGSPSLKNIYGVTFSNLYEHRSHILLPTIAELGCACASWRPSLYADFANTLRLCVSLVSLTIAIDAEVWRDLSKPEIDLPCLQYLSVFESFADPRIFTSINAPRLHTLKLTLTKVSQGIYSEHWPTTQIVAFLKRSTDIQVLHLYGDMWADSVFIILRHCPRLVSLQLPPVMDRQSGLDGLLSSFVYAESTADVLCPKLECLEIGSFSGFRVINFDTLIALIIRKLEPSTSLAPWKRLKIRFRHFDKDKEEIDQLLGLADPPRITIESV